MGVIGENSAVALGVVIGAIGAAGAGVWWAATLSAKVDTLISLVSGMKGDIGRLDSEMVKIQERVLLLEQR